VEKLVKGDRGRGGKRGVGVEVMPSPPQGYGPLFDFSLVVVTMITSLISSFVMLIY